MNHKETYQEYRLLTLTKREWTTCDCCQEEIKEWMHDVEETELYMRCGYRYPDGADLTKTYADICIKCFKDKVIPTLESTLNIKFREKDDGY